MALRNILPDTDPTLRKKSREVKDYNERIHTLLDDMRETLINANGLGLAAPQVGVLRRACIVVDVDIEGEYEDQMIELVNPVVAESEGECSDVEGCLSSPGRYGYVSRPERVVIEAFDRFGAPIRLEAEGYTARAYCHEIDHLNGILYLDIMERELTQEELDEFYGQPVEADGPEEAEL